MHFPWCVKWAKRPNAINVQSEFNQARPNPSPLPPLTPRSAPTTKVAASNTDPRVRFGFADLRQNKRLAKRYGLECGWELEKNIRAFREGEPWSPIPHCCLPSDAMM